jgi:hypothetical protein
MKTTKNKSCKFAIIIDNEYTVNDIATKITGDLITAGLIKDCVEEELECESIIQDIIQNEISVFKNHKEV